MNGVTLRAGLALMVGISLGATSARGANRPTRPFENEASRPRVSPYMNLVNNPQGAATNYQSLVRPQLEQQGVNRSNRAAIGQLQRSAAPTRSQSTAQGNQKLRGTGHPTTFNDTSRYFPKQARR
ncbi:MAG TPA: hypothetical protein VGN12_19220 [Pirellulales bacterium]